MRGPEREGLARRPAERTSGASERRMSRSQGTGIREGILNVEKREGRGREGQIGGVSGQGSQRASPENQGIHTPLLQKLVPLLLPHSAQGVTIRLGPWIWSEVRSSPDSQPAPLGPEPFCGISDPTCLPGIPATTSYQALLPTTSHLRRFL